MFLSQDVAIKLLRTEHLNKTMQQEFAQEVYIMRFAFIIFVIWQGCYCFLFKQFLGQHPFLQCSFSYYGTFSDLLSCAFLLVIRSVVHQKIFVSAT